LRLFFLRSFEASSAFCAVPAVQKRTKDGVDMTRLAGPRVLDSCLRRNDGKLRESAKSADKKSFNKSLSLLKATLRLFASKNQPFVIYSSLIFDSF
jgi:hypothetical protein